jgi:hypothetical protein
MALPEIQGPDLAGVVADATAAGLPHVVIDGFAVIAHGYPRSTKDSDLLVPDGEDGDAAIARFFDLAAARRYSDGKTLTSEDISGAQHLRVETRHGVVDVMRGGLPPLDFDTVSARATTASFRGGEVRVAALASIVGFKRLAGREQDRADLEALERVNGELPFEPIPGLDS